MDLGFTLRDGSPLKGERVEQVGTGLRALGGRGHGGDKRGLRSGNVKATF